MLGSGGILWQRASRIEREREADMVGTRFGYGDSDKKKMNKIKVAERDRDYMGEGQRRAKINGRSQRSTLGIRILMFY